MLLLDFLYKQSLIADRFENACNSFNNLITSKKDEQLTAIQQRMEAELKQYREDGILRVAFIGQYSAGKSTIISALTGKRDIKIDADIATDRTSNYDWNNIKIIDTPGIFTDRKDHDAITYEAINKADLLVFCLTYMLFDSLTVENFKKLAYEKGYRWKMMLVINKMSDEAGEEDEKIANYRESLAEALKPYSLDEFPVNFIDAKDYCDGVDEDDDFLLEISRFNTFTNELNNFVKRRGSLARFDTPLRIALSHVEEAQIHFIRNSQEDAAFFEILNQFSRKLKNQRDRLATKINTVALKMSSAINREGITLANAVGSKDFEAINKRVENNVRQHYEKAGEQIQNIFVKALENIQSEIEQVLKGDLVQSFIACLENKENVSARNVEFKDLERLKAQVNNIKNIAETITNTIQKLAETGTKQAAAQGFYSATDVAGSNLHHIVYGVGKFFGHNFQPWGAVGIAKEIGNFAILLAPILTAWTLFNQLETMEEEAKMEQEMADARRDITSKFQAVAKELETQILQNRREFETQIYGEIEKQISRDRREQEEAIASKDASMKQIGDIRKEFESILSLISPQN